MSTRWMTQIVTTVLVLTGAGLSVGAKPPDLPAQHKVRCQERPGVSAHDGQCVPTHAGYVPGGCIQLEEEQEAALFEKSEQIEIIDTFCPCVSEVLRQWIQALQQAMEMPQDEVAVWQPVAADGFINVNQAVFIEAVQQAFGAAHVEGWQQVTPVISFYAPVPFMMPHMLLGLAPDEDCTCSKKCQCGQSCACANCSEFCGCQVAAIGADEDQEMTACQCSQNCDCTTDCRCSKGCACSEGCTCGGEDSADPAVFNVGQFIGTLMGQSGSGKVSIHCHCTDNGACEIEIQVEADDDKPCACTKNCKCEKDCACAKAKSCTKACPCGKVAVYKKASSCGAGCAEACSGDKACACTKDCACASGCECCKGKSCGKGCACGVKAEAACCPMNSVIVVIVDHLKDSIRESAAVQVQVVEPSKFMKKTRRSCQQCSEHVHKIMKTCVKHMANGMRQAARNACEACEARQPEFPAQNPVKLEKKISCPFLKQKEADKRAAKQPQKPVKMSVSVLNNIEKLQRAQRMLRVARWYERTGNDAMAAFQYQRIRKLVPGSRLDVQASEGLAALEARQDTVIGLAEEEEATSAKEKKVAELISECRKAVHEKRWSDARKLADQLSLSLSTLEIDVPEPPPFIEEEQEDGQDLNRLNIFEGCEGFQPPVVKTVEELVAELLESCQRALAEGRLQEAEMMAQQAQMLDPDCVAAHALVYKTHLLIQIADQIQKDAEEQEEMYQGCGRGYYGNPCGRPKAITNGDCRQPIIIDIELPPVDPDITDALGKVERNFDTPGTVEESQPVEAPEYQLELEDVWPEVGLDPCDDFIDHGACEPCEEEACEVQVLLVKLVNMLTEGTCVEIGASPGTGWRMQCQVFMGDCTYSLYADEQGAMRCVQTSCSSDTDLRSAQREHNDAIIKWINYLNGPQEQ
ncbi:MAG: hypothetical protein AB7K24_02555 [Gemmataceae bacterium]